jgi:hypothetical protein
VGAVEAAEKEGAVEAADEEDVSDAGSTVTGTL